MEKKKQFEVVYWGIVGVTCELWFYWCYKNMKTLDENMKTLDEKILETNVITSSREQILERINLNRRSVDIQGGHN